MRGWFFVVARLRSRELFMLNVLLVTLGLAALTELAGLSFALGAFLAGMLIAETEYRYQVEEDIKPFRDVLLGLFFVSVGMYLDLHVVVDNLGWVLLLLVGPVLAKLVLVVLLARVFRSPLSTALRTGFYLAQAGEFAIVLLALSSDLDIINATLPQLVLAAMVLSMLAAPFMIQVAEPVVRRFTANDWLARAAQVTQIAARTISRQDHVIICGYGRSGQNLARLLAIEGIPFLALDCRSAARRRGRGGWQQRRLCRRRPARGADRGGAFEGARGRDDVRRYADRAENPAPRPARAARGAGDRAHDRR